MGNKTRTSVLGVLLCSVLWQLACRPGMPTDPSFKSSANGILKYEPSLLFQSIKTHLAKPSQVQFIFSLRDRQGHAILRPPEEIAALARIFESGKEIDYSETGFFVNNAAGFQLDVVLVLDFTNSMASWSENGRNAITIMAEGAKRLINGLAASHRVAVIEYHDRNEEPSFLSYFTTDKQVLVEAIDRFVNLRLDHGSSRCWDAVYTGISIFPETSQQQDARALLYLSDGFDTSSRHTPAEIIALAKQRKVQIYALGTGAVKDEATLQKLSKETEGGYYRAENLPRLEEQLHTVSQDLRGQYKAGYVSLRTAGRYDVRVQIEWEGKANYFEQTLDLGAIYGDDRIGRISFDESVVMNQHADVFIRATHVPRNISEFRFRFGNPLTPSISIVGRNEGGLCEGWRYAGPDADGYFRLLSPDATSLRFGDSGILFKATFGNLTQSGLVVPFHLDNSIYPNGKGFVFPETLFVGLPILDPQPADGSIQVDPRSSRLSWRVENPRGLSLAYDVRLDAQLPPGRTIASGLTFPSLVMPTHLSPNTTYYWRVVAYSDHNAYQGPVWRFTTK